ncbi:MAG: hypothetical protein K6F54_01920 [Lachnospiraceae bacterium]|nr:hypothetical protein [Lachnospiraceae bacterium]
MIRQVKAAVICLSVLLVLTVLFSNAFMIEESHHTCSDDECPICETLKLCDRLLRQTSGGVTAPVMVCIEPLYVTDMLPDYQGLWSSVTPVGDKVRMND